MSYIKKIESKTTLVLSDNNKKKIKKLVNEDLIQHLDDSLVYASIVEEMNLGEDYEGLIRDVISKYEKEVSKALKALVK